MKKSMIVFATAFFLLTLITLFKCYAYPDWPFTQYLIVGSKLIEIKDGMQVRDHHLSTIKINLEYGILKETAFDSCNLQDANFCETIFRDCTFRRANLTNINAYDARFPGCDFTDANISGARSLTISRDQLCSTWSFKFKSLLNIIFSICDFSGVDFSKCNLKNANLGGCLLEGCRFDDASVVGTSFFGGKRITGEQSMSLKQLATTWDFRHRRLIMMTLASFDFSEVDFSLFNLTGTEFTANFKNAIFDDAVISHCNFNNSKNLTLEQIKSTWNYKTDNMNGINLPKELQTALDAEKKKDPVEETN